MTFSTYLCYIENSETDIRGVVVGKMGSNSIRN